MASVTGATRGATKRSDVAPCDGLGHTGVRSKPLSPARSPTATRLLVIAKSPVLWSLDGFRHASYATTLTRHVASIVSGMAHAYEPEFGTPRAITVGNVAPPSA